MANLRPIEEIKNLKHNTEIIVCYTNGNTYVSRKVNVWNEEKKCYEPKVELVYSKSHWDCYPNEQYDINENTIKGWLYLSDLKEII